MARFQVNPAGIALVFLICMLVPPISALSAVVKYCNKTDYPVKVSEIEIEPYPVQRGKLSKFSISAYTDNPISGGKLSIDISYFGVHIHVQNHDLCAETNCPVTKGDFLIAHSQVLPEFTPPGSYTLGMALKDGDDQLLTCINFDFRIAVRAAADAMADS